jgi:lipopolysaccharide export system protein LptC
MMIQGSMLQTTTDISHAATAGSGHHDAYKAALAHSRRVRRLRVALPLTAALVSAVFIGVSFVRAYLPENLSVQSAKIEDGKIVMESPAIAGRNEQGISYSLTATRALQDLTNPNMITLENVKAAMPLNQDVIARVSAAGGIFDRSADKLDMTQPFQVNLSNGITANFKSAQLDVPRSTMETSDPVQITTNDAAIVANSMKISDNGKTLLFAGQVQVTLERSALSKEGNQSASP